MSARPASSVRRGSATISLARFLCARFSAAPKTGCDSVADVQVQPVEQRQRAHALAGGARRRAGLGPLSFRFDRPPRSRAPFGTVGSFPHPAPNPLLPAPSYQRPSEAVAVLREIVAEAALHAGGALVGGVQLDVGGRDADDLVVGNVQVHKV